MDWLEEKAGQLGKILQERSLVRALVWYLCVGMVGVGAMYWVTRNVCLAWIEVLVKRQETAVCMEPFYPVQEGGAFGRAKDWESILLPVLKACYRYCLYLYSFGCFCIVGEIFLDTKMKQPLAVMKAGLAYINMGDYSHPIVWRSQDEMGALCREMEQMRAGLLKEKRGQWKQQEEQRKINAAFAHDIRTPLTVIRGYTEFLQRYVPRGKVTERMLLEKLEAMRQQEERLFQFSNTMATIQKMEKWELSGEWQGSLELAAQMEGILEGIRQGTKQEITFQAGGLGQELFLDKNLLLEVFDNLLGNALRYGKEQIQVKAVLEGKEFTIFVKDDGPGFSEKALRRGTETYFSEEENSRGHFGIGLSICRMLCEIHGGRLALQNSVTQGAIAAATLSVGVRESAGPHREWRQHNPARSFRKSTINL